jgi:hypothetical protein
MEEYQLIQIAFPQEPAWEKVATETLARLVEHYSDEQSCATCALSELASRGYPDIGWHCRRILTESDADVWLRCTALALLTKVDPSWSFDYIAREAETCPALLFSEMLSALWSGLWETDTAPAKLAISAVQRRLNNGGLSAADFLLESQWDRYCLERDAFERRFGK